MPGPKRHHTGHDERADYASQACNHLDDAVSACVQISTSLVEDFPESASSQDNPNAQVAGAWDDIAQELSVLQSRIRRMSR